MNPKLRFAPGPGLNYPAYTFKTLADVCEIRREIVDLSNLTDLRFVEYSMPAFDSGRNPQVIFGSDAKSGRISIRGNVLLFNKLNVRKKRIWNVKNSPDNSVCSAEFIPVIATGVLQDYMYYAVSTDGFTKAVEECSSGTSNSQKRITPSIFLEQKIACPCSQEQQKIASFFSTLDEKIRIAECKIDRLELLKKGFAQKIFSRQIRFRKKNESSYPDWIKAPINKVAIVNPRNETTSFPDEFLYIDLESVSKGVLVKENIISKHEAPSRAQRVLKEGDILFQMVRPYQGNNYFVRKSNIARVASTGYAQIRSTKNNSHFIYQSLHQPSFLKKVMERCTGGAYPAINSSDFSSIELEMPCIEEQNRISQLFEFLDIKIDISRQRLMKLKSLKTNLLQKMFI